MAIAEKEIHDQDFTRSEKLSEMETIIRFDETGSPAILYTASPKVNKRIMAEGGKPDKTTKNAATGKENGWTYIVPKSAKGRKFLMAAIDFDGRG
jgi:hypothetical protein